MNLKILNCDKKAMKEQFKENVSFRELPAKKSCTKVSIMMIIGATPFSSLNDKLDTQLKVQGRNSLPNS